MISGLSQEILFEKFQIIEVLKKDEHAAVFLANHIYLSKKIILKVLNTQKISDNALVERFKREAKILAQLDSSYIIKVLDFGTFQEYFYISFEYIEGLSLRNLLKQTELTFDQKKHLMIQLLKGLHYAHSNQIIHRDIKPENIFVDNSLNLKIGDFGLALSSEDNFVTNPYSIVGTPSYMSPEQVRGAKLNPQSDLFSAGVVLVELFTGKNPFLKENVSLTLNEIMSYDESIILNDADDLPQEIKDVLFNLLRKNLKDRYNSAIDVLKDLGVSLDQPSLVITKENKKESLKRWRTFASLFTVIIIILFYYALTTIDKLKSTSTENFPITNQDNSKNEPAKNEIASKNPQPENINLENLDKPLIENKNEITTEKKQNDSSNELATTKKLGYGWLDIRGTLGTRIYINGEDFDVDPIKPISLQEGEYIIKYENPDYPPHSQKINIIAGQATKIRFNLDQQIGFINFDIRPFGKIFINEVLKGETPPPLKMIKVNPGFVRVSLKNPNYKDVDTLLKIEKGDTINFIYKFKK
ncbi:MAG: serine/threonine protein kinase [Melioribacteraceae bacterium]|nr:serine/threonine protein kinase [Melioribacteraceae bacterium]